MIELESSTAVAQYRGLQAVGVQHGKKLSIPWWLWANVFSADAVAVAILWEMLLARVFQVNTGFFTPAALGCSVWVIYLLDHALDARRGPLRGEPARKVFFKSHRDLMLSLAVGGVLSTAWFARTFLGPVVFRIGMLGGCFVAVYFGAVHLLPSRVRVLWPREAAVASLFSFGVCMPVWLLAPDQHFGVFMASVPFFLLCWVNCCAVERWDWLASGQGLRERPNRTAKWVGEHATPATWLVILLSVSLAMLNWLPAPYLLAVILSSLAVLKITESDSNKRAALRCVLLDVALCTPGPILLLLWLL